jgi:hypothetical protein
MPRHIDPPKTIAERGGLEIYLNKMSVMHNGLGYKDFLHRINPNRKHKISKAAIAEDFNVSPGTIYSWLRIHRAEQAATTSHPPEEV